MIELPVLTLPWPRGMTRETCIDKYLEGRNSELSHLTRQVDTL
jgi:hypothetical protein